jgi:hypothetical protein
MGVRERKERVELLTMGVEFLKSSKLPERMKSLLIDAALKQRNMHAKALEGSNG